MTNAERIGKRVTELRESKGISQTQLAKLAGLKQGNVSKIESGIYNTRIDTLSKIAEALGAQIDILIR